MPFSKLKILILNLIGNQISYKAKIGFSLLLIEDKIILEQNVSIGHFNFFKINKLQMKHGSFIGHFNLFKGPITVSLLEKSGISKNNKLRRAFSPISYGKSQFSLGENSFIVSNHDLDLTQSITIGDNSILAGIRSQLWTHGYYHADTGGERIRIDGEITIGDNVYVGSSCIFNPGVNVSNAIHIGGGTTISKDLIKPGMYVSQGLRYIENDIEKVKSKLKEVKDENLIEQVYIKS